ncbi:MAG: hypothetical protein OEY51_00925 [Cyclobacteriaceae bacterium]|nr:hypothetical protein [Cyclobacteriaceae bacterium]
MEKRASIRVFLIGNNPSDLSNIYDQITSIRKVKFITDYSFDFKNLISKVARFSPNCLLIDDNMEKSDLKFLFSILNGHPKTKQIPITIIQNSNKDDMPREGASGFILKQAVTSEALFNTIINSLKLSDFKAYFDKSLSKRKKIFFEKWAAF